MSSQQRAGLPKRRRMRHDSHYVDALASAFGDPIGRSVAVALIEPNPFQPRSQMGDLTDLVASIKERGILEPLIIRPVADGRYQLLSGERRLRAAQAAGLTTVPCVEFEADDHDALEVALIENIQRRDLEAFEEADGFAALKDRFEYTQEDLGKKLGRSRTAIAESLAIAKIPEVVRELCRKHGVLSRAALLQVARAGSREKMEATCLRIASEGCQRQDLVRDRRAEKDAPKGRPRHFAFAWQAPSKAFNIRIKFRKTRVSKAEVLDAVRELLEQLEDIDD